MKWDKSVDLLIAGSGGGGMVAALAAVDAGIEPLVVEKQDLIGGSTGMSGGMVWLPNNPLMRAEGIPDSHEDGLAYFDDVIGDIGAASSPARRETFLTAGYEMIDFLLRKGVRLVRCPGWSDYYPNHKGGNAAGRSVEGIPVRLRRARRLERQGSAVDGQELRVRGQDQRAARGAVLQPVTEGVRGRDAGVSAHQHRQAPASRPDDQRRILHRSDPEGPHRPQRRTAGVDERCDGRPHRRRRPRGGRARQSRRLIGEHPGAQGRSARGGWVQSQR